MPAESQRNPSPENELFAVVGFQFLQYSLRCRFQVISRLIILGSGAQQQPHLLLKGCLDRKIVVPLG